jgi:integrase
MSLYKRGNVWWFKFRFEGQVIRESANTASKTLARDAERARRRELERVVNGIAKRERPPLLSVAVQRWLDSRAGLAPHTLTNYRLYAKRLTEHFGERLVSDIDEADIADLIRKRQQAGLKPRWINIELAVLRMVLRHFGVWDSVKGRVRPLREPHDVGQAISREDEERILAAIHDSRSPALLPLFVLSVDTGLRASELRSLRIRDLNLEWRNGSIKSGWLTVSKSKTEGGTGRTVPITRRARAVLTLWLSRFPDASPDSYVFPHHKIGFTDNSRRSDIYAVDPNRPIGSWKKAWHNVLKTAELHYRWHDCRHTFISRLAENPAVSEQTIMTLAGHVSKTMLARYSHIRSAAKQAAIATLEDWESSGDGAQNGAQSNGETRDWPFTRSEKLFELAVNLK